MTTTTPDSNSAQWLAHIADMLGAEASGMFTLHPDGRQELLTEGHSVTAIAEYRDYYGRLDPLPSLLAERPDVVVSADMGCLMHLEGRARKEGRTLKGRHLAQVLRDALRPARREATERAR